MDRLTDCLDMTIVVDCEFKQQDKQKKQSYSNITTFKCGKEISAHSKNAASQQYLYMHSANSKAGNSTVNFLNIRTPKKFVVITLKFEPCGSTIE